LDVSPIGLNCEHRARLDSLAVDDDRARTAVPGVTPDMGPGEPEVLTQVVHEQCSGFDIPPVLTSIDRDAYFQNTTLPRIERAMAKLPRTTP
jgi:hypothetical protein